MSNVKEITKVVNLYIHNQKKIEKEISRIHKIHCEISKLSIEVEKGLELLNRLTSSNAGYITNLLNKLKYIHKEE